MNALENLGSTLVEMKPQMIVTSKLTQAVGRTSYGAIFEDMEQNGMSEKGTQMTPVLKLSAETQTSSSEVNRPIYGMNEVSMLSLGAQRQIFSRGYDDAVLCSPRFLTLIFNKKEKWIQFMLEVDLNSNGSKTESTIDLPKESEPSTSNMMKIETDMEFKDEPVNMNWKEDLSSLSKMHDCLKIERDQEVKMGGGKLLDPSTEDPIQEDFSNRRRLETELDPPPDLVWKDSFLVTEEGEGAQHIPLPKSSESNLERVRINIEEDMDKKRKSPHLNSNENPPINREGNLNGASDSPTKDELRRTSNENKYPFLKECFVSVKRLSRELATIDVSNYAAKNKALKSTVETKQQMKTISRSTRKGSDILYSINDASPTLKRIKLTHEPLVKIVNLDTESQSADENCKENINSVHKRKSTYCNMCDRPFSTKKGLNKHISSVHNKLKNFKCCICYYACSEKDTLAKHILSVHDILLCPICDLSFDLKATLSMHLKIVHNILKPYQCSYCDHAASHKGNLLSHMKAVHEKIKPFKCLECNYSCSLKSRLTSHMKSVHEKIKPFKCLQCNYLCSLKGNLAKHMKTVHEKIKPFK